MGRCVGDVLHDEKVDTKPTKGPKMTKPFWRRFWHPRLSLEEKFNRLMSLLDAESCTEPIQKLIDAAKAGDTIDLSAYGMLVAKTPIHLGASKTLQGGRWITVNNDTTIVVDNPCTVQGCAFFTPGAAIQDKDFGMHHFKNLVEGCIELRT